MATLAALRKRAKSLGIAASVIRGATSADELEDIIQDYDDGDNGNGSRSKKTAKKAVKKAAGKTAVKKSKPKAKPKASAKKSTKKVSAPKATGRGTRKVASSKSVPAKSQKRGAQAKRRATADDDAGRFILGDIDYRETEGWNPREGSAPDLIVRALRKFRGKREKVFEYLLPDLWEFVSRKKADGTRRNKGEAENLLRNRIAQTDWRFAIQTGQHQKSENRIEYGSGTDNGNSKAKAKKAAPKKSAKSTTKSKSKAAPKGRAKAQEAPKRRGRPPGSKNKPKAQTAPKRGAAKRAPAKGKAKPKATTRRGRR